MNSADVALRVRAKFGDQAGVQVTDEDLIRWINDAQRDIIKENEGLLEKIVQGGVTQGIQDYSLITLATDIMLLRSVQFRSIPLVFLHLKEFDEYITGWPDPSISGGTGVPEVYTVFAGNLKLFPIPETTEANVLRLFYVRYPVDVTDIIDDPIDLPLSYHNTLVRYVMKEAYEKGEDWQGHNAKAAEFVSDLNRLKNREHKNAIETYQTIVVLQEDL